MVAADQEKPQPKNVAPSAYQTEKKTPTEKSSTAATELSKEPFIIEEYFTRVRFENDGTGARELRVRAKIESPAGAEQLRQVVIAFNSAHERAEVRSVRVLEPGERTPRDPAASSDKSETTRNSVTSALIPNAPAFNNNKQTRIVVPGLKPGATLEYDVVVRTVAPTAPGQFWYEHNFLNGRAVLEQRLEIDIPASRKVTLHSAGANYTQEERAGRKIFRWRKAPESSATAAATTAAPDVDLTSFASWDEFAKWYAGVERNREIPSPEIQTKVLELAKGRATETDKIEALYEFVSKNIRHIDLPLGLGRYPPHSAAQAFKNGYGDSQDEHVLLCAMLDVIKAPCAAALISVEHSAAIETPSPAPFDHLVTAISQSADNKDLLYLDTAPGVAPMGYLASPLRGKKALLISADGTSHFIETPVDPPFPAAQQVEITGRVSELGKLTAHVRYLLRGDNEFTLRNAFHHAPQKDWKDIGQTMALLDGFRGAISNVTPSDPAEVANPFVLGFDYAQRNFLDWSSKKAALLPPLPILGMPDVPEGSGAGVPIGSPLDITLRLKLDLPANRAARAPVGVIVLRDYAEYHSSYKVEGSTLVVERTLQFKMRGLPPERVSDFLAFTHAVESDESQLVTVENVAPGEPAISASAKADELAEAGVDALAAGNAKEAVELLRRAGTLDAQRKDVWNNLGLAYLRLGQLDPAIVAFRKQLEVDPKDENANNYLGAALMQQQKFDQAAAALRRQIELQPLDKLAHASLGTVYLTQQKFADAALELEKAAILTPENDQVRVGLGQAYLNTGRTSEALAEFEKAAKHSPTPEVWNEIAYDLSLKNASLDQAEKYAEMAVDATSALLRDVDLEHLTEKNLGEVQNLGAFWDTLGWVRFVRRDTDGAEPFLRAAWSLTQNGDVGGHLAALYERRGQRDLATRTYALAMAAPHPGSALRERAATLLGEASINEGVLQNAREDLIAGRTYSAGKLGKENAEADFFLILAPSPIGAKVEAVKFIRGSESLRSASVNLFTISFGNILPDVTAAKLIRRGTLKCTTAERDCTLVLMRPEDVITLN